MDLTKQKIISIFREKATDISTNDLASSVYPEYLVLEKRTDTEAKRKLAKLHRKLLHHINKLIDYGILRLCKYGEKGKKFYSLNIDDNEEITEFTPKYKKSIVISKPSIQVLPIEGYEKQGIVTRFQENSWVERLNSIVIVCDKINDLNELKNIIQKSFSVINDSICLEKFEDIINSEKDNIANFLLKLNEESEDYGKIINCSIDLVKIKKSDSLKFLEDILKSNIKNINFVFGIDSYESLIDIQLLKRIISLYLKNKRPLHIKNKRIQKAPIFLGNAGPYSPNEKEWEHMKHNLVFACSQSSLVVDVDRFHSIHGISVEKFSQLMMNISKSFLASNSLQRKNSGYYFKEIMNIKNINKKEFLSYSRNYIRLWNYGISQPEVDPELVVNMINEARKKVIEFSNAEETIYNSCGMPIKFKIALSCAYNNSVKNLSNPKYKRIEIKGIEDIYSPKIKKEIKNKEKVTSLFDGGNEVSFHRIGSNLDSEEIIREIYAIINAFDIPLITYDFSYLKGDMKLTSFFEE